MYRSNGPHANTFDFTPKFYQQACAATPAQLLLAEACNNMRESAKILDKRINCISTPGNGKCKDIIALAESARKTDTPKYTKCLQEGKRAYNQRVPPTE